MDEYDKKVFAKNLNRLMEEHNVSQTDIKNILGVSKSTVSAWCNGIKIPRMDKIETLAKFFNCRKSDLIEDKPKESETKSTDKELKVALFGGDGEVTDEMWDEVKKFAQYIKSTYGNKED
ncbi:MAG TPA: helix-turn-helix domain-containing protein [Candidatus Eubacterium faecipullorum]|uniref:Helix-turn-helix domain-containing protein n=1 Tax=Candidatus Eubacterium faecipullorum TaxID=2838571 RepID=A0A9D1RG84_9FIRM|nr:helix-turn-helix domain-containing protein [Candidatus Eubacterium faecipullorum]